GPPSVTITDVPPANATGGSFSFTGQQAPSGAGALSFKCSLDGNPSAPTYTSCTSPRVVGGLADGSHTFRVVGHDLNGDGTPAVYSWTVAVPPNTNPPTSSVANGGVTQSKGASFNFSSPDTDVTHFDCSLAGPSQAHPFTNCGVSRSYSNLGDGAYTLQVRAVDNAGNQDLSPASVSWTVDTVAPDTQIDGGPTAGSTSTETSPSFQFSGGPGASAFSCSLTGPSGPTTQVCASPKSYSSLPDGVYTFSVAALDQAGNMDASPATRTWTIDVNPPSVPSGMAKTGSTPTSIDVSWSPSTDAIGVTGYEVFLNGQSAGTTPGTSATLGGLACGTTYGVAAEALDAAGLRSARSATVFVATAAFPPPSSPPPADPGPSVPGPAAALPGPTIQADTLAPTLLAGSAAKQKALKQKALIVTATSSESGTVAAIGTLKIAGVKKPIALKAVSANAQAGAPLTLRLALDKKTLATVKKALGKRKKASAVVTVTASDAAGNVATAKRTIKLIR
ncbi:MAG: large repetitive protein, partial [Thermoleophilales bacterium]|nr:large repetitive protein [Thermoleophilales bacterium]